MAARRGTSTNAAGANLWTIHTRRTRSFATLVVTTLLCTVVFVAVAQAGSGARVIDHGPNRPQIALTFDDDFCGACVDGILQVLASTRAEATFCPNGVSARAGWSIADRRLARRLVARGQIAFCNHTYSHFDVRRLSPGRLADELNRNGAWIEATFGTDPRPYFRPPYGAYNAKTLAVAGQLGYGRVVMWSGTLADSSLRSVPYLLAAIRHWAKPGAIILAHGDHPNTAKALRHILAFLRTRHLRPVTLTHLFGGAQTH